MHILVEFVRGAFVKDDGVVGLVLDCRPDLSQRYSPFIHPKEQMKFVWAVSDLDGILTYPFPSTTSSFASCLLSLREPSLRVSRNIGLGGVEEEHLNEPF